MSEPVFPQEGHGGGAQHPGMSVRTLFMALSMMGQRASGDWPLSPEVSERIAKIAEADADALIEKVSFR